MAALTCCAGVAGDFSCRLQPLQLGLCSQALLGERPQLTSLSRKAITSLGSLKEYAAAVGFACSSMGTDLQARMLDLQTVGRAVAWPAAAEPHEDARAHANKGSGLQHNWEEHAKCMQGLQQQGHRVLSRAAAVTRSCER